MKHINGLCRQLRLTTFQIRQYVSVPYFIQLMVFSTLAAVVVQYCGFRAFGGITTAQGWVRAGVIGMWSTATTAAGIIGFERYKGTLVYLVSARIGAVRALASVVSAAASFAIVALPFAWCVWALLQGSFVLMPWGDGPMAWRLLIGGIALFAGCLAIAYVIAAVFILTPNAISYEGLLLVPIMVASGVLFTTSDPPQIVQWLSRGIPIGLPMKLLFDRPVAWWEIALWWGVLIAWGLLARACVRRALRKALVDGTLEVM